MSGKYGFGGGIELPKMDSPKPRIALDQGALKDAVEAGTTLGFVSREPSTAKRKPGPKRTEAQDKVSIPGPKRVIDQFRAFCTEQNVTLWEGLDLLLQGGGAIIHAAISAIDLALWDLRARSLGVPVYDLFGGPLRDEIAVYANGWNYDYPDADGWARASERPLRDGYSFLKCYPLAMPSDTGGTLRHPGRKSASPELIALGVDRIRRLRDLAGDSVRIAIDLCAAVAPADLLRFARQIEDCGIEWLEEAGDPADPGAFTAIAAGTPIPLAAGERFFGLAGFRDLIASRAVSVLQPDLGTCGGFSEFQQIAALANSYSHKISPHNCGGAVLTAASLQMAACTANFLALETFPISATSQAMSD